MLINLEWLFIDPPRPCTRASLDFLIVLFIVILLLLWFKVIVFIVIINISSDDVTDSLVMILCEDLYAFLSAIASCVLC